MIFAFNFTESTSNTMNFWRPWRTDIQTNDRMAVDFDDPMPITSKRNADVYLLSHKLRQGFNGNSETIDRIPMMSMPNQRHAVHVTRELIAVDHTRSIFQNIGRNDIKDFDLNPVQSKAKVEIVGKSDVELIVSKQRTRSEKEAAKKAARKRLQEKRLQYRKPLKCELCDYVTFQRCHLRDHMSTHNHKNSFHCNICLKRFKHKPSLRQHLKRHDEHL